MKDDRHYFIQIACACMHVCGGESMMVFKGLEPSFSSSHGNRTLRTTWREVRGGGGVEDGETEGNMGSGVGVCIL